MSKFYEEIYKLKQILRRGWLLQGVDKFVRAESDAEHTFSTAMLSMEIMHKDPKYQNLDQLKVLKMVLVHELCEIDAGDTTPYDNVSKEEKFKVERKSEKRIATECGMPEIFDLWKEFEQNSTPEAQFVKKMDRLDAIIQAKIYSKIANNKNVFLSFVERSPQVAEEFKEYIE